MKRAHRRQFLQLAAGALALPAPTRPVRIVVGFPAGGGQDILAHLAGQGLSERFGQTFFVENKPGAGTNLATASAAPERSSAAEVETNDAL